MASSAGRRGGDRSYTRGRRLLRSPEFIAVQDADPASSLRFTGSWLSMTSSWSISPAAAARLGVTVSARMSPRSIDRSLVKRVVREAFRHRADTLDKLAQKGGLALAVSFRLKRPVGARAKRPPLAEWRRALRSEADSALARLEGHLAKGRLDA